MKEKEKIPERWSKYLNEVLNGENTINETEKSGGATRKIWKRK